MRCFWALIASLALLNQGCGTDICEEAREAFCAKACDCEDGGCAAQLDQAGFQYYDSVDECLDLAGPQICDSEGTEQAADACSQAIADMGSCGDTIVPSVCRPFPDQGTGAP